MENTTWWYVDILLLGLDDEITIFKDHINYWLSPEYKAMVNREWAELSKQFGMNPNPPNIPGWIGYVFIGAGLATVEELYFHRCELPDSAGITPISDAYPVEGGYAADFIELAKVEGAAPTLSWVYQIFSKFRLDLEIKYRAEAIEHGYFYTNSDRDFYYCKHFTEYDRYEAEEYPLEQDTIKRLLCHILGMGAMSHRYISMNELMAAVDAYNNEQLQSDDDYYISVKKYKYVDVGEFKER